MHILIDSFGVVFYDEGIGDSFVREKYLKLAISYLFLFQVLYRVYTSNLIANKTLLFDFNLFVESHLVLMLLQLHGRRNNTHLNEDIDMIK